MLAVVTAVHDEKRMALHIEDFFFTFCHLSVCVIDENCYNLMDVGFADRHLLHKWLHPVIPDKVDQITTHVAINADLSLAEMTGT